MIRSERPFALYEKIKKSVIRNIETGALKPDDRVPSETQLARDFNASRMTANRALKELTEEGRIIRVQGVGTFVARPGPDTVNVEITSIADQITALGGIHSAQVLLLGSEPADREIAWKLDLDVGQAVFHSIIVHMDRTVPIQYSERFINPAVAPDYLVQDFQKTTPCDYLLEVAPVQRAEHTIRAILCEGKIRDYLDIPSTEPCLSLQRRTWSFDQVATYSTFISPGSRYHLHGEFLRG